MNRIYGMVLLFIFGLSLNSCVEVQGVDLGRIYGAAKKAVNLGEKTETEEQAVGDNAATVLLEKAPLVDNPALQKYVNRVGYWLAMQSERPELNWRFAVIENPSVNAFAAPGGYVFITTGMLANIHNEAQLAGVLAHEIAHVVKKHHLEAIRKKAKAGLWADLTAVAVQTGQASYNKHQEEQGSTKRSTSGKAVSDKVDTVVTDIYNRGLDRDDEFEADRMGVVIAARSGYDPYAFVSVLQTLGSRNPDDTVLVKFLKVHPNIGDRLEKLEPVMDRMAAYQPGTSVVASRYKKFVR